MIVHDYISQPGKDWIHDWIVFQETEHLHNRLFYGPKEQGEVGLIRLSSELYEEIALLMKKAQKLMTFVGPYKLRRRLILNVVEEILLLSLPEREKSLPGDAGSDRRIQESLDFMHEHFAERITVPELAERVYLSTSRYSHLFRQMKGVSPGQYLQQFRIGKARELLISSNLSVGEIAARCGFDDLFYFSNLFRRLTGISPRGYRAGVRSIAPLFDSANPHTR